MPTKKQPSTEPSSALRRLRYVVEIKNGRGDSYLYYRREGRRIPLVKPEGSHAFRVSYDTAERSFEVKEHREERTVREAIAAYYASPDFRELAPSSQRDYRRRLDEFRGEFGDHTVKAWTEARIEKLRTIRSDDPVAWNALRSRMIMVVRHYRRLHPDELPANPWEASRRLKVEESHAHKPWPPEVLLAVMRAATPAFRALLVGYLLTAQRGGDVTTMRPDQYDPERQTLQVNQIKTGEPILLHVPASLARAFEAMAAAGAKVDRLFVSPRGVAWQTKQAQETLRTLLRVLKLPRYTLHGLRATGPTALKLLGFENRAIRALTGHTSDKNLELYLRGVDHYPLAKTAQEALEEQFAELLAEAEQDGNVRRYVGVTGKEAKR